ncbi:MAG: phosphoribosylglycinamide formyltransferase [Desulfobacterales bacterium]|jgi:phosphoribosylglycinamide formyltransferase-1
MNPKLRIGALISGGGTNLQAVIDACENHSIDGRVVFVGSDNPEAKGLGRAGRHNIPTFVVDYGAVLRDYRRDPEARPLPADFDFEDARAKCRLFPAGTAPGHIRSFLETRALAEAALIEAMRPYPYDLLILAGFMRNLTPYFIDRVNTDRTQPRIMNIHPAILPSFPGVDGYGDTYNYGCKVGGCTVHFIDYGEDSGPIIGQRAFAIQPGDTLETFKQNGLAEEWKLYPYCIQLYAQGKLTVVEGAHRRIVAIAP